MRVVPVPICNRAMPVAARHWPCWSSGIASLDAALSGGLARGRVHEFHAADTGDTAAMAGFVTALVSGMVTGMAMDGTANDAATRRTILWLRARRAARLGGVLQANGWAELGGMPDACLFALMADDRALLRASVDALRCAALGAVVVEAWGAMRALDLTASRRLALAAEKSGVSLFLLRMDAEPMPSAAQTRWQVAAAPSRALPGNAPGHPCFDITLLRQRSGPCGQSWRLEWDRDQRIFREAAIPGAVVSVPVRRPAADTGAGSPRRRAA